MTTKTKLSSYEKETTKQLELKFTEPAEAGPAREQTGSGKDYWSDCGQVFFTGGNGYGLNENLRMVCLGAESDILNFFKTGKLTEDLDPDQRRVLLGIREYRQEEGIGIGETDL